MRAVAKMSVGAAMIPMIVLSGGASASADQQVTTEKQTVSVPAPAPATTTTTTQPVVVQQAPAPAVPVQAAPSSSSTTHKTVAVETENESFMGTIAKSAFFGALTGFMIGGAIYLLDRPDGEGVNVAYWTAGGTLLGTAVGVIQVAVREDRTERALSYLDGGVQNRAFKVRLLNVAF